MSRKIEIPPVQTLISSDDTRWAIAAKVPADVLNAARYELSDFLQEEEASRVVSGKEGMSALLAFGGSVGEGEELAVEISQRQATTVYVLDFDEYAISIGEVNGVRVKWREEEHPADFLESYGIIAPGYEPRPGPVVTRIGVVDGVTVRQARRALPESKAQFTANSRGVIVEDEVFDHIELSRKLGRRSFTLFYYPKDGSFACVIRSPDHQIEECLDSKRPSVLYSPIDSILGETTLDGILRVLDIPRHMLFSDGGTADGSAGSP